LYYPEPQASPAAIATPEHISTSGPDQLATFTRNNLAEELATIKSFNNFFNTTMPTTLISANTLAANRHLHTALLFHLQNQIVTANNSRLFFDLIASNSISPYSVNCSSDLLLLNYFSQVQTTPTTTANHEFYAITLRQLREFTENEQGERLRDEDLETLIQRHEPNAFYRSRSLFSFVGFARYLNFMH